MIYDIFELEQIIVELKEGLAENSVEELNQGSHRTYRKVKSCLMRKKGKAMTESKH